MRRICIVQVGGIGDMVHALPVGNALRDDDPKREIVWVAQPGPAQLLQPHRAADRVVVFDRRRPLYGLPALFRSLSGQRFDLTVNMRIYGKSAFPTLFSRAPVRLGMPRALTRDLISLAHTHHLPGTEWKHWQDIYLDFLPALGLTPATPIAWRFEITEEERRQQRVFFSGAADRPVVGIVLASSRISKDWPVPRLVELADALSDRYGLQPILLGGPSARERQVAAEITRLSAGSPWIDLDSSVRDMIWRIDGCDLVISPDTGPLHVAHALDVPVIGLFGSTDPRLCGPYSRFHDLLVDKFNDHEGANPAPMEGRKSRMWDIDVGEVLDRVEVARTRYGAGNRKRLGASRASESSSSDATGETRWASEPTRNRRTE